MFNNIPNEWRVTLIRDPGKGWFAMAEKQKGKFVTISTHTDYKMTIEEVIQQLEERTNYDTQSTEPV